MENCNVLLICFYSISRLPPEIGSSYFISGQQADSFQLRSLAAQYFEWRDEYDWLFF